MTANPTRPQGWLHRLSHSLRWRLMALFLLLTLALSAAFIVGTTKAFSGGWRDAVKPLLSDYVDRLALSMGSPPDIEKARALTQRLPIAVRIEGPVTQFDSHPERQMNKWRSGWYERENGFNNLPNDNGRNFLKRITPDGHTITFGMGNTEWRRAPGLFGWLTLAMLLGLTTAAFMYVRRLFKPLDDIGAGVQRFGSGNFSQPIAVARCDELGDLAGQINTMGQEIASMLDAKRALLLAISHELRSPLTRARLNTELIPDEPQSEGAKAALLRDLNEMARLINDLLESERLSGNHAALNLELTDLGELVNDAAAGIASGTALTVTIEPAVPLLQLDRTRIKLLLRNLLDNAQRHGQAPIHISLSREGNMLQLTVRDHGPGIPADQLPQLGQAFFRPDAARQRSTGGVGLGLYLCRLVAKAHGGELVLENAGPGLEAYVRLPV
jgi:signal transduction histidine kinase